MHFLEEKADISSTCDTFFVCAFSSVVSILEEFVMFQPTHWLVSRSRRLPVVVTSSPEKSLIYTEDEWNAGKSPAFELHPKLGMFCRGVQVLGFALEPMEDSAATMSAASLVQA